jgi:hypothetical protein
MHMHALAEVDKARAERRGRRRGKPGDDDVAAPRVGHVARDESNRSSGSARGRACMASASVRERSQATVHLIRKQPQAPADTTQHDVTSGN